MPHAYLRSGTGTVGPLVTGVPGGLSLTPTLQIETLKKMWLGCVLHYRVFITKRAETCEFSAKPYRLLGLPRFLFLRCQEFFLLRQQILELKADHSLHLVILSTWIFPSTRPIYLYDMVPRYRTVFTFSKQEFQILCAVPRSNPAEFVHKCMKDHTGIYVF
jgi:hypothetical protein